MCSKKLFITISIMLLFLESVVNADYTLESEVFKVAVEQGSSDSHVLFSSSGQSQSVEVSVGNATSESFHLFAGFFISYFKVSI